MIGRVILAALLAGIAAGILMSAMQAVRITPLILQAETYEVPEVPAAAAEVAPAWQPSEGFERTLYTSAASIVTGAGFALMMAAVSLLTGVPITLRNGAIWGLAGFIAVSLAPSAGLPPALPGVPAGDLVTRQVWWTGTAMATGLGIFLVATKRAFWPLAVAVVLIMAPHFFSLPQPASIESAVPPTLAAIYTSNVLAASAAFWTLIGVFLGYSIQRATPGIQPA